MVESQAAVGRFLDGTGIRWLRDDFVELRIHGQWITIIGMTCRHDATMDAARSRAVIEKTSPESLRVLVYHSPDIAPSTSLMGIDLYLCGHTHGGQWRLPGYGALITSSALGNQFEMGRYELGQMVLYVTRGIGMEGASAPRAQLLCPPEIIY
jgi:hypothetical protein